MILQAKNETIPLTPNKMGRWLCFQWLELFLRQTDQQCETFSAVQEKVCLCFRSLPLAECRLSHPEALPCMSANVFCCLVAET
jgi:hypothetical protein